MPHPRTLIPAVCVLAFVAFFARLLVYALEQAYAPLIALAGCGFAGCLVTAGILIHVARWNRRFHALRCQECNYDLHITPHRCPECGWESTHVDSELQPFLVASALDRARENDER